SGELDTLKQVRSGGCGVRSALTPSPSPVGRARGDVAFNPGHSRVGCARGGADFGDEGFAEGEEDVAVLMSVTKDWVAEVGVETPTGGVDDFVVAIKGGGAAYEIEDVGIFDF